MVQGYSTAELRTARIMTRARSCGIDPSRFRHCRTWKEARAVYRSLEDHARMMLGEIGAHYEALGETREGADPDGWRRKFPDAVTPGPVYTVEAGRTLMRDGKATVYLGIVLDNAKGGVYAVPPAEADALAHEVAAALNSRDLMPAGPYYIGAAPNGQNAIRGADGRHVATLEAGSADARDRDGRAIVAALNATSNHTGRF